MIKTLRIAGVLSAAAAIILFALPVVFGSANGKDTQKFLDSDTIIEKFKKIRESQTNKNEEQIPPLVKEATDFARYLDPPPPPPPGPGSEIQGPIAPPPAPIVQFKLISTCVHQTSPELSLALIDLPGEGQRWVMPSNKIGHFIVEEIKSGLIIVNNGQKNLEVKIETGPSSNSLLSSTTPTSSSLPLPAGGLPGRAASARSPQTTFVPPMPASGVRTTPGFNGPMTIPTTRSPVPGSQNIIPITSMEDQAAAEKFMSQLDAILSSANIGENATEEDISKTNELIEKYFKELDNMQISEQEAQKISDMGQKLDKEQQEPNRPRPTTVRTKPKTTPPE